MKHVYDEKSELRVCKVCGLFEGNLTTDCPRERSHSKSDEIYNGVLDYRENEGWVKKLNPTKQIWLSGDIWDSIKEGKYNKKEKYKLKMCYGVSLEVYEEIEKEALKYFYLKK